VSALNMERLHAACSRVVRNRVAGDAYLAFWAEDLTQEVWARAAAEAADGHKVSRRSLHLFFVTAVGRMLGEARWDGRRRLATRIHGAGDVALEFEPAPAIDLAATTLCMRRLQARWDELTAYQQAAVQTLVTGDSWTEVAHRLGTTQANLWRALQQALGRIDGTVRRGRPRALSSLSRAAVAHG
jgi:DNA-directed RNA polymerase specialized sigma24 family protein